MAVVRLYRWVGWAETHQSGVSACARARSHLHINSSQCAFTNCDTSVFYKSNINFVRTSFMIHTGRGRGIPLVNIMYTGRARNIPSGVTSEHMANCPSLVATPAPHSTASSHNARDEETMRHPYEIRSISVIWHEYITHKPSPWRQPNTTLGGCQRRLQEDWLESLWVYPWRFRTTSGCRLSRRRRWDFLRGAFTQP